MFSKETYIRRRAELKRLVGSGVVILFGNDEAPYNYPANGYTPMRQDSTFLYYFGQHRDGLVGIIDIDNDEEWLLGDDIDVDDIVWMGFTPSVADLAAEVGVTKTGPLKAISRWRLAVGENTISEEAISRWQSAISEKAKSQQPTARRSTFCRPTATTRRSRSWTCLAFIPRSRRRPPA